jgi:sigma-B regulation protein RsbU (phosphoserine phosphatase)
VLVVFSDGITEALNTDGAEFGEARLMSSITANRAASAQTILERLLADVQEFIRGVEQSDDLTALILRYTGS